MTLPPYDRSHVYIFTGEAAAQAAVDWLANLGRNLSTSLMGLNALLCQ